MPNGELIYRRGEIWWIELDPAVGVETRKREEALRGFPPLSLPSKKTRACLILQNDFGNRQSSLTTIAPFLERKNYPFVVNFYSTPENGLDKARGLHLNQIRAIDSQRIKSKLGEIEDRYWNAIKTAIAIQLKL